MKENGYFLATSVTKMLDHNTSLQLIPMNIIAYRSQYGSANLAAVIAPATVATFFSTVMAMIYCKIMGKKCD